MRINKITIAALAVVAGLSLTACQNDDAAAGQSDSSTSSSANGGSGSGSSAQNTAKDSAAKDSAGENSGEGQSATGKCRTDELEVTATDSTIEGDPEGSVAVEFTNGGGRDCTISGYAGVDLKTNAGSLSAERTGEQAPSVTLKDGESVAFGITYPVNDSGGSGIRITGLVVTPPDETKSVTLDWPGAASLPVTDGSGSSVQVGPIGSAGQGG
ncbi:DUF4232 domain-containing protein [Streptomyces sp. NPDC017966]|uniref:DUF4232 domain-containing protein n=1 Tax=unclassified Streptomyces TaxID=2593676 RepID=UPI001C21D4DD|nr:DUF4232 domain-containing protein [Streptomyces sp. AC558_RSS880]